MALLSAALAATSMPQLKVSSAKFSNGLQVFVVERHHLPVVAYYTFFRAGSRYERPGITGISHFLEHMMFNGSRNYGPNQFDEILEGSGGYSNAYTSHDITAYYEVFPPSTLETVVKLESDRMASLLLDPRSFEAERKVIMEERRMSTDNDPTGKMEEVLENLAFFNLPYRWPVIGWMDDIKSITRQQMLEYYRSRYAPNNALIVVAGDVEPEHVFSLVEKYYSTIKAQKVEDPPQLSEPEQLGERVAYINMQARLPAFLMGYKVPSMYHPDAAALQLLSIMLSSGESCIFEKRLVYRENLAASYYAHYYPRVLTTLFYIFVEVAPEKEPERAFIEVEAILRELAEKGPEPGELEKAKNKYLLGYFKKFETSSGLADLIGRTIVFYGDWKKIYEFPALARAVTVEDIKRVVSRYFRPKARSLVWLVPEGERVED